MIRFLLAGLFCTATALAHAQVKSEDHGKIAPASIPLVSPQPAGFVPAGWKVEQHLTQDLNGDQRPDQVLVLIDAKVGQEEYTHDERALLVLLAQATAGGWQRVGIGNKVLLCQSCYGLNFQGNSAAPQVQVAQGVLIVEQYFGGSMTQSVTYRFRYESASKRMRLIGLDNGSFDQSTGITVDESTNYLTGKHVSSQTHSNEDSAQEAPKVTHLILKKTYLEEVDIDDFR